jgi:hypothetical protein
MVVGTVGLGPGTPASLGGFTFAAALTITAVSAFGVADRRHGPNRGFSHRHRVGRVLPAHVLRRTLGSRPGLPGRLADVANYPRSARRWPRASRGRQHAHDKGYEPLTCVVQVLCQLNADLPNRLPRSRGLCHLGVERTAMCSSAADTPAAASRRKIVTRRRTARRGPARRAGARRSEPPRPIVPRRTPGDISRRHPCPQPHRPGCLMT